MSAVKIRIAIEMEDGTTWEVVADQRDLAAWEACPLYDPQRPMKNTMTRYIAWSASKRQGKTELTWPRFNAACIEAGDPPGEIEGEVDPTQPDQPAES